MVDIVLPSNSSTKKKEVTAMCDRAGLDASERER